MRSVRGVGRAIRPAHRRRGASGRDGTTALAREACNRGRVRSRNPDSQRDARRFGRSRVEIDPGPVGMVAGRCHALFYTAGDHRGGYHRAVGDPGGRRPDLGHRERAAAGPMPSGSHSAKLRLQHRALRRHLIVTGTFP